MCKDGVSWSLALSFLNMHIQLGNKNIQRWQGHSEYLGSLVTLVFEHIVSELTH